MATRIWVIRREEAEKYKSKFTGEGAPWGVAIPDGIELDGAPTPPRDPDIILKFTLPNVRFFEADDMLTIGYPEAGVRMVIARDGFMGVSMNQLEEGDNEISTSISTASKEFLN